MQKRLLIAAGDSNTDADYWAYKPNNIKLWPELVAEKKGYDLINVARSGFSNAWIENSIFDAVMENKDRDIVVMVLWTAPERLNVFDLDTIIWDSVGGRSEPSKFLDRYPSADVKKFKELLHNWKDYSVMDFINDESYLNPNKSDTNPGWEKGLKCMHLLENIWEQYMIHDGQCDIWKHDETVAFNNYRTIRRTKVMLENMGIEYQSKLGLSFIYKIPLMFKGKEEYVKRVENLHLFLNSLERDDWEHGWKTPEYNNMLLPCGHPNQRGHHMIASKFGG